jgi:hypothetical protein
MIMNQNTISRRKQVTTTMGINVETHKLDDPFAFSLLNELLRSRSDRCVTQAWISLLMNGEN